MPADGDSFGGIGGARNGLPGNAIGTAAAAKGFRSRKVSQ